jgi:GNAT superfamily N-acetyltransferase
MPTVPFVRPAVLADAEAIARVHVAAWHETYTGLMPQSVIDIRTVANRTERWRGILGAEPRLETVFVAEVDGGIVGFAGVGRALFHAGQAAARDLGAGAIGLWALTNNSRARRFYEKVGCVAVASRDEVLDGETIAEIGYRLDL